MNKLYITRHRHLRINDDENKGTSSLTYKTLVSNTEQPWGGGGGGGGGRGEGGMGLNVSKRWVGLEPSCEINLDIRGASVGEGKKKKKESPATSMKMKKVTHVAGLQFAPDDLSQATYCQESRLSLNTLIACMKRLYSRLCDPQVGKSR